jgi:hypothetical protein
MVSSNRLLSVVLGLLVFEDEDSRLLRNVGKYPHIPEELY